MARDTRQTMIRTAMQVLRERGADGLTVDEVLARSGAPKGSVYHHFPGGRAELLDEALDHAGSSMTTLLRRAATDGPESVLREFTDMWRRALTESGYAAGCPVVSVAISGAAGDDAAERAGRFFAEWMSLLTNAFEEEGLSADVARQLATMSVATVEGAVILCRATRSVEPLETALNQLRTLIKCHRFARDTFAPPG